MNKENIDRSGNNTLSNIECILLPLDFQSMKNNRLGMVGIDLKLLMNTVG
jgi:hypothetical protein